VRNWTGVYRVRRMCYTYTRNIQPAHMRVTKTSVVQKELVDFRR